MSRVFMLTQLWPTRYRQSGSRLLVQREKALQNREMTGCETIPDHLHPFRQEQIFHIRAVSPQCVDRHLGLFAFRKGGAK